MRISDTKSFGKELKRRRKNLGYTQAYVSDFSGFSTSFLSDVENGKSTCEFGKCIYLANLLGIDVDINFRGDEDA